MAAERLTPRGYQGLLDRGWRRSGTYLYRPRIEGQCCAHYTIRQDATQFEPSAGHKKVLRKFEAFLNGAWAAKQAARHTASGGVLITASEKATLNAGDAGGGAGGAAVKAERAEVGGGHLASSAPETSAEIGASRESEVLRARAAAGEPAVCVVAPSKTTGAPPGGRQPIPTPPCSTPSEATRGIAQRIGEGLSAALRSAPVPGADCLRDSVCNFDAAPGSHAAPDGGAGARTTDGSESIAVQVVVLRSSLCWQAASKEAAGSEGAEPMSKAAAKRRRRAAAKAARAPSSQSGPPAVRSVAARAADLAESALPLLQAAVQRDAELAAVVQHAHSERGHLFVDVVVPFQQSATPEAVATNGAAGVLAGHLTDELSGAAQERAPAGPSAAQDAGACNGATDPGRQNKERPKPPRPADAARCDTPSAQESDLKRRKSLTSHCVSASEDAHEAGSALERRRSFEEASGAGGSSMATESSAGESGGSGDSDSESDDGARAPPELSDTPRHKWWLEPPPGGRWPFRVTMERSRFRQDEFELWRRYQHAVHKDPVHKTTQRSFTRFLVDHPFPAQEGAAASEHSDDASGELRGARDDGEAPEAPNWAAQSHNMRGSLTGGGGHAMDAAACCEGVDGAPRCGYGAFHMQYWIGEHLVAVGVVDILPRCSPPSPLLRVDVIRRAARVRAIPSCLNPGSFVSEPGAHRETKGPLPCRCVSSKYFLWDPDLAFLSLGVLSAMKEIEWSRRTHAVGLHYSYLGFYIHSNQKMRCALNPACSQVQQFALEVSQACGHCGVTRAGALACSGGPP